MRPEDHQVSPNPSETADREHLRIPVRFYAGTGLAGTGLLYLFSGTALSQGWIGGGGRPVYLIVARALLLGIGMLALRGARSKQTVQPAEWVDINYSLREAC